MTKVEKSEKIRAALGGVATKGKRLAITNL